MLEFGPQYSVKFDCAPFSNFFKKFVYIDKLFCRSDSGFKLFAIA